MVLKLSELLLNSQATYYQSPLFSVSRLTFTKNYTIYDNAHLGLAMTTISLITTTEFRGQPEEGGCKLTNLGPTHLSVCAGIAQSCYLYGPDP